MDKTAEICFALLRFIFMGVDLPEKYKKLSDEDGKLLYALAKRQDISHIIALGVDKTGMEISDEVKAALRKNKMAAFYRSGIMWEEQRKISKLLESEKIKYMPLKGSVIKKFYPEEWLRTGSDIDFLVEEENLDLIGQVFTEKLSYKAGIKGNHDVGFKTPSGAHIEMHYKLLAREDATSGVLDEVWNDARLTEDGACCYEMSPEMFIYYHIAHMVKHFRHGGCGIRFFLDLWLIENNVEYNEEKLFELLKRGRLLKFFENANDIIALWLYGKNVSEITEKSAEYVLSGGVYGNAEHHVALKHSGRVRKLHYLAKRIFISKKALSYFYPKIKKYPILTPYYAVKRWLAFLNKRKWQRIKREVSVNMSVKRETVESVKKLMGELEI